MIPKRAMRDRLSTALDTTDTSHLLVDMDQDWRLLGDSRSYALPPRANGAESDAPTGFESTNVR